MVMVKIGINPFHHLQIFTEYNCVVTNEFIQVWVVQVFKPDSLFNISYAWIE